MKSLAALLLSLPLIAFLTGCGGGQRADDWSLPAQPLDRSLEQFAAFHARRDFSAMRAMLASQAVLDSPVMSAPGNAEAYIRAFQAEPFSLRVSNTEILYSTPRGAKTRSRVQAHRPASFSFNDKLDVVWQFEDGAWRISRMNYVDWSPMIGTWRRAGPRGQPSLELRILPGGNYLLFADRDRSYASFRGTYTIDRGTITLTDTSAADSSELDRSAGRYRFVVSGSRVDLKRIDDENGWRAERFDGLWSAAR